MRKYFRWIITASVATILCGTAPALAVPQDLEGEYSLTSSSTAPINGWGYSKGHISIKRLDDRHLLILLACEWLREPKVRCGDYLFAQQRDGGVYVQDMNTDAMRLYFDAHTRTLTIISRGFDAEASVRRDVFKITTAPLSDAALMHRLQREQTNADSKENLRVFGHYSKWSYLNNRVEYQNQ